MIPKRTFLLVSCLMLTLGLASVSLAWSFPGVVSTWHGHQRHDFAIYGRACIVVKPQAAAEGNPWIWRARFFGHEPQLDLALLERGFHLAYCDVANLFGNHLAVTYWDAFYETMVNNHGLAKSVALEGMSRGGLIIYNWAAKHPERVAAIYADAPVCDLRSWPLGRGEGTGAPNAWQNAVKAYGRSPKDMLSFDGYPIYNLKPLALAGVPIIHVVGEADRIVPVAENSDVVEKRYKALGGLIEVIRKPGIGHHPHSLKDPTPIADFIANHTKAALSVSPTRHVHVGNGDALRQAIAKGREDKQLRAAFIGGSITQMNGYRPMVAEMLEDYIGDGARLNVIDAGISSTCSTTGAFRFNSDVLSDGPVDLLFMEFAVNDDQDASHSRQACLRGVEGLVRQALKANPSVGIVITYFVNPPMLKLLQAGQTPVSIAAHDTVAKHYGTTTINLAKEVANRVTENRLTWKQFGGTHPAPVGNRLAMRMIQMAFDQALAKNAGDASQPTEAETKTQAAADPKTKLQTQPQTKSMPAALDSFSYERGRFLPPPAETDRQGFAMRVPDWPAIKGQCREHFRESRLLCATDPGATVTLRFEGTAVGAYVLAGPDAGLVEGSIDGKDFGPIDLYHRFSKGLHYPRTVMFATDLSPGNHALTLRLPERSEGPGGQTARILHFVAN